MKLFMLHERTGIYTQTLFEPKLPTEAQRKEVEPVLATMTDWLVKPEPCFTEWGPPWWLVEQWARYLAHIAVMVLHLKMGAEIVWINKVIATWAVRWAVGAKVGAVFYYVGLPALTLLILYIVNPGFREDGKIIHYPEQYVGVYENKMWLMDLQMLDSAGVGYYFICSEIPGQISQHQRNIIWVGRRLDQFSFDNTWHFLWHNLLQWRYYVWNSAFAEYIGMLTHVFGPVYMLREPVKDPYLAGAPVPWSKPVHQRCFAHFSVP